jgi:hypothetical protein
MLETPNYYPWSARASKNGGHAPPFEEAEVAMT